MPIETATEEDQTTDRYARFIGWLGGRKFLGMLLALVSVTVLTYTGKVDGSVYQWVMIGVVAAYVTGNVAQKQITKNEEKVTL
jgi:hypothetical protein